MLFFMILTPLLALGAIAISSKSQRPRANDTWQARLSNVTLAQAVAAKDDEIFNSAKELVKSAELRCIELATAFCEEPYIEPANMHKEFEPCIKDEYKRIVTYVSDSLQYVEVVGVVGGQR